MPRPRFPPGPVAYHGAMTMVSPRLRLVSGFLLLLLALFLSLEGFRLEPRFGWFLAATLVVGGWLGWVLRQAWLFPATLARAETRWAAGEPASAIAEELARATLATGELGYRIHLLRSAVHQDLGYRHQAWLDLLEAQLSRLPFWKRVVVRQAFRPIAGRPSARRLALGERFIQFAPHLARLRHLQGILLLRSADPEALHRAWEHFEATLPMAWDDPLVLEDLMLAGLQHGREDLTERALAVLRTRHGDPRMGWNRGPAGMYLLRTGRPADALALVRDIPPSRREHPLPWLTEGIALRRLGDLEGAWRVVETAVAQHPDAFQLWMERHQVALELQQDEAARHSLLKARDTIPEGPDGEALRQEWLLRRAEFAFWWEDRPEAARELIDQLPLENQGDHHPPLRLQILVAQGEFEAAYREVAHRLLHSPQDVDLLLLQADCLAGMEAWEALLPYLDGLGEAIRERPAFWHLRGLARANQDDPMAARLDLERAVRMDPHQLRYLLDAGHGCAELGDWDRAENHWRQALQVDEKSEEALIHLAEARRELEDLEGARRYLRECLLHHPDSTEAQARLAELEAN